MGDQVLRTERLILRSWRAADREPFAAMNADPLVMEHLPALLTREQSDAFVDRIEAHWQAREFGLFAVEVVDIAPFIGFVGLAIPRFELPFEHADPPVEIGWRMAAPYWRQGYAVEAASAAIAFGLNDLGLPEVLSWTVPANVRSVRVMERIGMTYVRGFEHPGLASDSPLRHHVLYRRGA